MKIFDIETYKNLFLIGVYSPATGNYKSYRINDRDAFLQDTKDEVMVSFNGKHFDNPIIFKWLEDKEAADESLYKLGQDIIAGVKIWELKNEATAFFANHWREHIDLITFFTARIGLKQVAINCGSDKIQDLPYSPHESLTEAQKEEVDSYCENDCKCTFDIIKQPRILSDLKIRKYINENIEPFRSSKTLSAFETTTVQIAEKFMLSSLAEHNNCSVYNLPDVDRRKPTIPNCLRLVPRFKSDFFKQFMKEIKDVTFSKIEEDHLQHLTVNQKGALSKKTHFKKPGGGYKSNYFLKYRGKEYNFGLGGLHSKDVKKHWYNTEERELILVDVASYYPSMITMFKIDPIPGFSKIEGNWRGKRYALRDQNDLLASNTYKLMINMLFGKLNEPYSKLYSPISEFSVTITGQVLLLYLIEIVQESIECQVVNANTDGVCFYIKRSDRNRLQDLCAMWEKDTLMELDYDYCNHWIALGCNEYCAEIENKKGEKKLKTKGARFIQKPKLDGKLNAPIVSQAVVNYFLYNLDPATFIRQNATLENVLISSKSTKGFHTWGEALIQKSVRYFHSTVGKELKSGHGSIITHSATVALDISELKYKNRMNLRIDYDKYENMASKVINEVLSGQIDSLKEKPQLAIINATATKIGFDFSVLEKLGFKIEDLYPCKTFTSGYSGCGKKEADFYTENGFIKGTTKKATDALCYQLKTGKEKGLLALEYKSNEKNFNWYSRNLKIVGKEKSYLLFSHTGKISQKKIKEYGFKAHYGSFIPFFATSYELLGGELTELPNFLKK